MGFWRQKAHLRSKMACSAEALEGAEDGPAEALEGAEDGPADAEDGSINTSAEEAEMISELTEFHAF